MRPCPFRSGTNDGNRPCALPRGHWEAHRNGKDYWYGGTWDPREDGSNPGATRNQSRELDRRVKPVAS